MNILIKLKNQNRSDYTIKTTSKALTTISKYADLNKPEQVKAFIANKQSGNGYKRNLSLAYNKFCDFYKIEWTMPIYKQETKLRRIPTTENVNMLIAKAQKTLSVKLTLSKETGLRPIELCNLKVKDIDLDHKTIYPTTAKNGSARALKISNSLQTMITNHINTKKLNPNDKLFKGDAPNYGRYYRRMRNYLAEKLGNPTLKTISLYDFRHYFATKLYAKTRDILYVRQQMGHKKIETTLKYVQLLNLEEDDEWTCKIATTTKEIAELVEHGFIYVTELNGDKIFKKRK
ncbi:Tyrosine recombinase XerC [subsurface metagenome]